MAKQTKPLTLEAISNLIDKKFDQRLKPIERALTNISGEVTYLLTDLESVKSNTAPLETKTEKLEQNTAKGFEKVEKRFDEMVELIQAALAEVTTYTDQEIKKIERKFLKI